MFYVFDHLPKHAACIIIFISGQIILITLPKNICRKRRKKAFAYFICTISNKRFFCIRFFHYSSPPLFKLIEKIEDNTIKELAQKIQWIGNDGAHYINFHTDRNYTDMKKFLNIVIAEIQKQLIILDAQSIKHKNK